VQRGRSEAERLGRVNANRTMESDGHQTAQAFNVNVASERRCEWRWNWAQKSTEF
jgi:hypothetical protein